MTVGGPLPSRSFEDFEVGSSVITRRRTITEADIGNFAGLTWDSYPLHTDEEYARTTEFGTRIAHGPLVYAFAVGMMPMEYFGDAIVAFLGVDGLRHRAPVFAGDTIHVVATVKKAKRTSRDDRGIVTIEYVVLNQADTAVMEMEAQFLMRCSEQTQRGRGEKK